MNITSNKFDFKDFPNISCPTCNKGFLIKQDKTEVNKHPSWIITIPDGHDTYIDENGDKQQEYGYWDIEGTEHEEFITSFYLICNRKKCQETVVTCGKSKIDVEIEPIDNFDYSQNKILYYYPKIFYPPIHIINIPIKTPELIQTEIKNSFLLYWSSPTACVNSIRKVLEKLIDELEGHSNDKLHHRIENLSNQYQDLKNYLMAAKWIGNEGSHGDAIYYPDVRDAYEFLEFCLFKIYEESERDLNSIAVQINQLKKPISSIDTTN